jgi:ribosomal protein L37AE/L43A
MRRINKKCPHCGSLMVYTSREYKWKCAKCTRYELNPIEISHPFEAEMYGHQIAIKVLEMRTCTECGKKYEARVTAENTMCKRCYNRITDRARQAKKRQQRDVEQAA